MTVIWMLTVVLLSGPAPQTTTYTGPDAASQCRGAMLEAKADTAHVLTAYCTPYRVAK